MDSTTILNDTEIMIRGIEVLNKYLGAADAMRFLSLIQVEHTDYVEVSRRLYQGQTVDDIFKRAKQHWKE